MNGSNGLAGVPCKVAYLHEITPISPDFGLVVSGPSFYGTQQWQAMVVGHG
jgi:hypothetical protein